MVIYEVTAKVERETAQTYREWLHGHVNEMMGFSGFEQAEICERSFGPEERPTDGSREFVVTYRLRSRRDLDSYLSEHAPRMRADAHTRFAGRFSVSRRVLDLVSAFGPSS